MLRASSTGTERPSSPSFPPDVSWTLSPSSTTPTTQRPSLYIDGVKIGYVPADKNGLISTLAFFGHTSVFECRVLQVAPEKDPWEQVRVGIYVVDAR